MHGLGRAQGTERVQVGAVPVTAPPAPQPRRQSHRCLAHLQHRAHTHSARPP